MKNKKTLVIAVGILVLVLVGGSFLVKSLNQPVTSPGEEEEIVDLPPADPSIVVAVEPKPDGRSVVLSVSKIPSGTESVEYELSYLTGEGLPKGALGKISLNGASEVTRDVLLGTCSTGGKCTYDTGVTSVKLVLKFNHPSGATQFSQDYSLE